MTLLNFPPTNGQPTDGSFTYTANGVIYSWDGEKWTANSEQGLDGNYVNKDGDTMTGDLTVPSLNGGPLAGMRNVLINGDFRVQQRYQESGEFVCDRWFVRPITAVGGSQRCFIGDVGNGQHVLQIESTNATSHTYVSQKIEAQNIRHLTGKQVTFSCRTDFPNPVLGVATYDSSGTVTNTNYNLDTAAGGERFVSFTLPNAQIGETDTSTGVEIIVYVNGATGIPPNGNHSIRNIQLEPGNQPTPFEHRPIGTELALCQRYYQKVAQIDAYARINNGTDLGRRWYSARTVTMRTSPTEVAVPTNATLWGTGPTAMGDEERWILTGTARGSNDATAVTSITADAEL